MGDDKNFIVTFHTYDQIKNESFTVNVSAHDVFTAFEKARDIVKKDEKLSKSITGGSIDLE